jgi:hypothetical protein
MYLFFITFDIISPYTDNNNGIHLYSSPDCFISHFQIILNISIIDGRILKVIIPYFVISCVEFISCRLPVFYSKFISSSLLLYCNASVYRTKDFATYVFICRVYLCLFLLKVYIFLCFITLLPHYTEAKYVSLCSVYIFQCASIF